MLNETFAVLKQLQIGYGGVITHKIEQLKRYYRIYFLGLFFNHFHNNYDYFTDNFTSVITLLDIDNILIFSPDVLFISNSNYHREKIVL